MSKYSQLTKDDRLKIEALLKRGIAQSQIALDLNVNGSTISREIKRNQSKRGSYRAIAAEELCNIRKERFSHHRRLTPSMERFISEKLQEEQWSPEQISGYCKSHGIEMVSHERIYQFIYQDKAKGGSLYKHLRIRYKPYRKRYSSYVHRGKIPDRVSIEERPAVVNERSRIGDWKQIPSLAVTAVLLF